MSTTTTPTDLIEIQYRSQYWREYVRESGFKPYMGAGSEGAMSVIHTAMEPTKGGKSLTIPLVGRLAGSGVEGNKPTVPQNLPPSLSTATNASNSSPVVQDASDFFKSMFAKPTPRT